MASAAKTASRSVLSPSGGLVIRRGGVNIASAEVERVVELRRSRGRGSRADAAQGPRRRRQSSPRPTFRGALPSVVAPSFAGRIYPRMPKALQTAIWFRRAQWMLAECHRRFGDTFQLRIAQEGTWVFVTDREEVRKVFTSDPKDLHAGEANRIVLPGPASLMRPEPEPPSTAIEAVGGVV